MPHNFSLVSARNFNGHEIKFGINFLGRALLYKFRKVSINVILLQEKSGRLLSVITKCRKIHANTTDGAIRQMISAKLSNLLDALIAPT